MPDYMKLQNGSDIRGVAIETEGGKPVNLTKDVAMAVGGAFAKWLREKCGEGACRVAVGRDSRLSGQQLSGWITEGLCAAGMDGLCGMCLGRTGCTAAAVTSGSTTHEDNNIARIGGLTDYVLGTSDGM